MSSWTASRRNLPQNIFVRFRYLKTKNSALKLKRHVFCSAWSHKNRDFARGPSGYILKAKRYEIFDILSPWKKDQIPMGHSISSQGFMDDGKVEDIIKVLESLTEKNKPQKIQNRQMIKTRSNSSSIFINYIDKWHPGSNKNILNKH